MSSSESISAIIDKAPISGFASMEVNADGRTKLPAAFRDYLRGYRVFCTTLFGEDLRFYIVDLWRENLRRFEAMEKDPQLAPAVQRIRDRADIYGEEVTIDDKGRLTLPRALREKLGINGQTVYLRVKNGVVEVITQAAYDRIRAAAEGNPGNDRAALMNLGQTVL
jgi:AbrB family looped-hinge helix DNA binding protein